MTQSITHKRQLKSTLLIVLSLLMSAAAIATTDDSPYEVVAGPEQDSNGIVTYFLNSEYVNGKCRVQILRPEKPTNHILYLLPVTPWPGFEEKWDRLGSGMTEMLKHDFHNRFGYTVVVPDFPDNMPWFVDHAADQKRRHESYMMNVLVPFVDQLLGVEAPVRDLAGFSKAGFGSLSLLLRHPDVFHAASVWDPGGLLKSYRPETVNGLSHATGSQQQFDRYQLDNSIRENATHFRTHKRIAISGYSNDAFRQRLHALRDMLDSENLSYSYSESIQVPHRWYSGWMEQALASLQEMRD